ncbi:MAG TPA: type II and III secretion system protein family protein [Acidobacteriaceae bacterium]|nr:type II and III secretion system protein family protein [Acidobacteriaceae bacterium]
MKDLFTFRKTPHALLAAALSMAVGAGASAQAILAAAVPPAPLSGGTGSSASAVGEPLHLVMGHSMFVNTESRMKRVYVSNPDVLDSYTASPHQIVITARAPGISSLILWDEDGKSQSYLVNSDVDVSDLRNAIREAFPSDNIRVEGHGDQVGLAGTVTSQKTDDAAVKLASIFSKNVADSMLVAAPHTPQVRLKVRVVEIDRSRAFQLGFNFFSAGKNTANTSTGQFPAITVGNTSASGSGSNDLLAVSSLLSLFYYNADLNVGAAIQALINKQILQILAEPTLSAISGEKASFLSGGEFPYPVVQGGTGGFTSVTIQFRPYGVRVDFTPTVLPDGTIQLKVAPEVSALDYSNEVVISGYTIPAISTRRAETVVQLKDGQSFAISGLLDNRTTDQLSKIPGIGDIPILGKLFQTKVTNHASVELAVIVTPTLVDPLSETPHPTQPKMVIPFIDNKKFDKEMTPKTPPAQPQPQPRPEDVPVPEKD